jgi:hypothetical protein
VLLVFSLSVPSIAQNTILVPSVASHESSLAPTGARSATQPKLALEGNPALVLSNSQSRAEVSQQMAQVDAPAVEDGKVVGEKKKFLGGLFLYMLLKSQER